ncbi:GyrI-like domain-containing protein [Aureivirga sp. CE67]|uniref:AraC family transcriptional regulator n=1 Tax=Aureivirga sp. CE67 TaxID=1788983 RepID=UPI0018CA160A|nr:AraC family transcriptional regulator [Aureivirga sp. CE67]
MNKVDYIKKVNIVINYIEEHLDENLSLEKLAEKSNLSKFHFHRILKAILGENIGEFITRLRVEKAANLLRYSQKNISEIAYEVGFETPSGLSKRFKKFYSFSPKEYRENKNIEIQHKTKKTNTDYNNSIKIVEIQSKKIAFIRLHGSLKEMKYSETREKLRNLLEKNKIDLSKSERIGIYYDNPNITEAKNCRYDVAFSINEEIKNSKNFEIKEIKSGKYAVFTHFGALQKLEFLHDFIYEKWLFETEFELRNIPTFEVYLKDPRFTKDEDLITELYIPIR